MPSFELRDVSYVRRGTTLLENVDLTVPDGATVALVGPSGAGKSLLLRLLVGLVDPTEGDVVIDDEVVTADGPRRRDLSMMFDDYALHPRLDVYDNLAFSARLRRGVDAEALQERVDDVADFLALTDVLDGSPADLDDAERQRVAAGRALVRDARGYLLDDPFSAQSDRLRPHVRSVVLQWQRERGRTTLLTTSDIDEALVSADQVAVMHQGFVHQIGTPRDLYERPEDMFVAGYLGSPPMNLVPGFPEGDEVVTPLGRLTLSRDAASRIGDRQVVVVGMRPEHLQEMTFVPTGGFGFTAPVDDVEWRGRSQLAYIGFDIDEAIESVLDEVEELVEFDLFQSFVVAELAAERPIEPGARVQLGVTAEHVHLFDPVSGENLTA